MIRCLSNVPQVVAISGNPRQSSTAWSTVVGQLPPRQSAKTRLLLHKLHSNWNAAVLGTHACMTETLLCAQVCVGLELGRVRDCERLRETRCCQRALAPRRTPKLVSYFQEVSNVPDTFYFLVCMMRYYCRVVLRWSDQKTCVFMSPGEQISRRVYAVLCPEPAETR